MKACFAMLALAALPALGQELVVPVQPSPYRFPSEVEPLPNDGASSFATRLRAIVASTYVDLNMGVTRSYLGFNRPNTAEATYDGDPRVSTTLNLGFEFNPHFAAILGYADLGTTRYAEAANRGSLSTKAFKTGFAASAMVSDRIEIGVKLGRAIWSTKLRDSALGTQKDNGTENFAGFGLNLRMRERLHWTTDFEAIFDRKTVTTVSTGFRLRL